MIEKRIDKSHKNLVSNLSLDSLIFLTKRAAPPAPLPLRAKKLRFFAFRGRASLNPLLAKNRRGALLHPLNPIFCTTKRARLRVLTHIILKILQIKNHTKRR